MTYEEAMPQIVADIPTTLNRFSGNKDLMKKFICKFPQDKTLEELKAAVGAKNYTDIETSAHTLKGVSGNLGFSELFAQSAALVTAVREKRFDDVDKLSPLVIKLCEKINNIILQID